MSETTFSKRLREARRANGMTQEQLAAALHVSTQTISRYESGGDPSFLHFGMLAFRLNVTPNWLFGFSEAIRLDTLFDALQVILKLEKALGTDIQGDFPKPLADALRTMHTVRDTAELRTLYDTCIAGTAQMLKDYKISAKTLSD